jgi:hypothetical protein
MQMSDDDKTYTTVPTSQKDLEARLDSDFAPTSTGTATTDPTEVRAPYATEDTDTSAYIGVSPEYMTHADVTTQPFRAEEGPEDEVLDILQGGMAVAPTPDPKKNDTSVGGGSLSESVYTATSGEDFSSEVAKKADAPKVEAPKVEAPPAPIQTPTTPVSGNASPAPAAPASPAAPAGGTSSGS